MFISYNWIHGKMQDRMSEESEREEGVGDGGQGSRKGRKECHLSVRAAALENVNVF